MSASARRNDVISIVPILVRLSRILHNNGTAIYSRTSRTGSAAPVLYMQIVHFVMKCIRKIK